MKVDGVTKVAVEFVWSPNYISNIYPHYSHYYPGDDYVDWVGVDGYNWGSGDPRNPFLSAIRVGFSQRSAHHRRGPAPKAAPFADKF